MKVVEEVQLELWSMRLEEVKGELMAPVGLLQLEDDCHD